MRANSYRTSIKLLSELLFDLTHVALLRTTEELDEKVSDVVAFRASHVQLAEVIQHRGTRTIVHHSTFTHQYQIIKLLHHLDMQQKA